MRTGEPQINVETKREHADGSVTWDLVTKMLLRDPAGNIMGTFGVTHDITQRKQADEALAKERNLLRTVIDNLPDRIYAKDTECRFILNNPAHLQALGAKNTG